MKPLTTKERVANLEEEISCMNKRLDELIKLLTPSYPNKVVSVDKIQFPPMPDWALESNTPQKITGNVNQVLFKKPIMYLYNMTGTSRQIAVDFGSSKIPDAVPAIRADGKLVFNLDSDGYINNKYKYLYYEIEYDKPLPKGAATIYVSNDKFLSEGLANLARLCGLWSQEITDFVGYWELELKRSDCAFWKCDILTEKELDPIIPITVSPKPEFFIRRYIKFSESDKGQKTSSKVSKDIRIQTPFRSGELRVCEWGGVISDAKVIK